jgi:hypothetical protein
MAPGTGTKIITAKVVAVFHPYKQTVVRTRDGWQYAIVAKTDGIKWDTLKEGDEIVLEVYTDMAKVKEVLNVK